MKLVITIIKIFATLFLFFIVSNSSAQCTANFTHVINPNGNVNFLSTSTPTNTNAQHYWNFGNNTTFTATGTTTATITYTANGSYTVSLFYLTTVPSCTSSIVDTIVITNVTQSCSINASFTYTQGSNGLVNFTSNSTGTLAGTTYTWNYGNSTPNGTGVSTTKTYSSNGTYFVTLYAQNNFTTNCIDSITIPISVNTNTPPCNLNANFVYTQGPNGIVSFTSSSTSTTFSTTYVWQYGDNSPNGSGPASSHTYSANGIYFVTLYANNNFTPTCLDSVTIPVTVSSFTPPPCNINANFSYSIGPGGLVNFISTSTGTNSSTSYFWSFYPGTSIGNSATNTYSNTGTFSVTLQVSYSLCSNSITQNIVITCNLSSKFTHTVGANGQVNFSSNSTGTTSGTSYFWNFGNGNVASNISSTQQYNLNGTYTVMLLVTSSFSTCTDSAIQVINVTSNLVNLIDNTISENDFSIYPNPNNGEFDINIYDNENKTISIKIYSLIGDLVYNKDYKIDDISKTIFLKDISSGIYFVKLNFGRTELTKKVIINKY